MAIAIAQIRCAYHIPSDSTCDETDLLGVGTVESDVVAAGREREVDVPVGAMEEEVTVVEFGSVPNGTERNISVCAPSVHPYSSVYSGGVMASSKNFMEIRKSFIVVSSANEGAHKSVEI